MKKGKHKWIQGICKGTLKCTVCGIIREEIRIKGKIHTWYYGTYLTDSDPGCERAQENHKL
jgi:hypothetical protein